MKFSVKTLGAIAILVLIGVVVYSTQFSGTGSLITTTPASFLPSFNAYGKLVEYSISDGMTKFKIEAEIRNYELNKTIIEAEVNNTVTRCCYRDSLGNELSLGPNFDINKTVLSINDLKVGEIYCLSWNNFCGKLMEIFDTGATNEFSNNRGFVLKFDHFSEEINLGDKHVFYFSKRGETDILWQFPRISANLTEYEKNGKSFHENDLFRDQMIITEDAGEGELQPGQQRAGRIFSTSIIPNEETELKIKLTNKQDTDIPYKISNVKLVDELILEPYLRQCGEGEQEYREITTPFSVSPSGEPIKESQKVLTKVCSNRSFEQRIQDSTLSNCQMIYDSSENTISPNSSKIITFKVLCKAPVSCRTWYISETYGNVSRECSLILTGNLEFTDELDNNHEEDNVYLKQMLTLSQKASADVDYSKEISSKAGFYINVDYENSQGNQIKDAQIELRFKNLGVSGIFTLRYNETLGKYQFRWPNFVEWDPGYKTGNYQFTITAIKTGYQTVQLGPYEFTLKPES